MDLRVGGKTGRQVDDRAAGGAAGGGVVATLAQAVEQRLARQLRQQKAGQPANGAEHRRTGIARAGAPLVAVGIGDDADAVAEVEGVVDEPFERAPGGVHLDGCLEASIMGGADVGIASTAMGIADHVPFAVRREGPEQVARRVRVGVEVAPVLDQGMRRAPDLAAGLRKEDIAIAAETGVSRPFVSGDGEERAGRLEFVGEAVEMRPELVGDLEVVTLVRNRVNRSQVTRKGEIVPGAARSDGFLRLAVQVRPEGQEFRRLHDLQRVGDANRFAGRIDKTDFNGPGRVRCQTGESQPPCARP